MFTRDAPTCAVFAISHALSSGVNDGTPIQGLRERPIFFLKSPPLSKQRVEIATVRTSW